MIPGQPGGEFFMNLVESALSRPREERESYLREACGEDARLFEEVRSHVEGEERMKSFLVAPLIPRPPSDQPLPPEDILDGLFRPGDILEGRFHILREVARGGMGVVYEAHDAKLDRRIALKCAQFGHRRHLPREVRNASEVSHPNVCKIFEIHTAYTRSGEIDFITMEFLDGETLSRLRRGRIPEPEARTIARQVCEGLAEAHRNQVIHGDLKSNNIILTADPGGAMRAVITDFGMAHQPDAAPGTVFAAQRGGTPGYMAPELWRGEKSTIASDLYALGVILFELISGRRPDQILSHVPSAASHPDLANEPFTASRSRAVAALRASEMGPHRGALPGCGPAR